MQTDDTPKLLLSSLFKEETGTDRDRQGQTDRQTDMDSQTCRQMIPQSCFCQVCLRRRQGQTGTDRDRQGQTDRQTWTARHADR